MVIQLQRAPELLLSIAGYLTLADLNALSKTSHYFHSLLHDTLYKRAKEIHQGFQERGHRATLIFEFGLANLPPLLLMAVCGNIPAVKALLDSKCCEIDYLLRPSRCPTALHLAVGTINWKMVRYLVEEAGADLEHTAVLSLRVNLHEGCDAFDEDHYAEDTCATPLHLAFCIEAARKEMIELLLDLGANIEARDTAFHSVLDIAVLWADSEIGEMLLKRGANVNAADEQYKETAIHRVLRAIFVNFERPDPESSWEKEKRETLFENLYLLIKYGADLDAENRQGETPRNMLKELFWSTNFGLWVKLGLFWGLLRTNVFGAVRG